MKAIRNLREQVEAGECRLYKIDEKSCEALTGETCLIEFNVVPMTISKRIISYAE